MPKNIVVIGPPGTGKTRLGIDISKGWFDSGAAPGEVAYLSFTKAAADVAASRIEEATVKAGEDVKFPYFRTIHSLAYRELKKHRDDVRVVTMADMKLFSMWSSFEGKFAVEEWEDLSEVYQRLAKGGRSEWDDCLTAYAISRISCTKLSDLEAARTRMSRLAQRMFGRSIDEDQYRIFVRKYEDYKRANGLIDFTDMLAFALCEMQPISSVRYAVVDECLPAGTPVALADGRTKAIEDVTCDDTVLGYDHIRKALTSTKVVECRRRTAEELVVLNDRLALTPNHPVYVTGRGYVKAGNLGIGDRILVVRTVLKSGKTDVRDMPSSRDEAKNGSFFGTDDMFQEVRGAKNFKALHASACVCGVRERQQPSRMHRTDTEVLLKSMHAPFKEQIGPDNVCVVRNRKNHEALQQERPPQILRRELRSLICTEQEKEAQWSSDQMVQVCVPDLWQGGDAYRSADSWRQDTVLQPEMRGEGEVYPAGDSKAFRTYETEQPHARSGHPKEGQGCIAQNRPCSSRPGRKWMRINASSGTLVGKAWGCVDSRSCDGNERAWLEMGEAGSPEPVHQAGCGMRRWIARYAASKDHRQTQGAHPAQDGMGNYAFHEPPDHGRNRLGCFEDTVRSIKKIKLDVPVYNIGTTTQNYFASGVLVHNCQDLAPVLHSIVERVFQDAEEIWWAGDVNQTIFSFAAADAKLFIKRAQEADHRVVLSQTRRFGQEVVDFSTKIIMRAQDRIVVDVKGFPGKTHVLCNTGSFQPTVKPMMILHRHVAGCKAIAAAYIAAGMPFRNERGRNPLGADARVKAFTALYDLSEDKDVLAGNVGRLVDDLMPSILQPEAGEKGIRLLVHGAKKKIQDGLLKGDVRLNDLIQAKIVTEAGANLIRSKTYRAFKHPDDLEYYHRVIENGYSLHAEEIPIITTIHGSKGREAPSVVVFSEMGRKCWDDQDSEHRLAYVAATRTQGELEICAERTVDWAKSKYNYPLEKDIKKQAVDPLEIDFDA